MKKPPTTPANSEAYGDLGLRKPWDLRDIKSKPLSQEGRSNWDRIFGKKKTRENKTS